MDVLKIIIFNLFILLKINLISLKNSMLIKLLNTAALFVLNYLKELIKASFVAGNGGYDRHRSVRLVICFDLAIDQIAQSGLSSLKVIYYLAQLFSTKGDRYIREVDIGRPIGTNKFNNHQPTSIMTILTDKHGNLITATPGRIK